MLLRMSRLASTICRLPVVEPLSVTPIMTRLASRLGGTGRLAKVNVGNLYARKFALWQDVRPTVANAIRRPQRIWGRRDWAKRLRFVNGNKLQPERCGVFWWAILNAEYNKGLMAARSRKLLNRVTAVTGSGRLERIHALPQVH